MCELDSADFGLSELERTERRSGWSDYDLSVFDLSNVIFPQFSSHEFHNVVSIIGFRVVKLNGANLRWADLRGSIFRGADLGDVDLSGAIVNRETVINLPINYDLECDLRE